MRRMKQKQSCCTRKITEMLYFQIFVDDFFFLYIFIRFVQ